MNKPVNGRPALLIADLHLSPQHPRLVRGFVALLQHYQGTIGQLYILGDWFEVWIGDDDRSPWLDELVGALQQFVASGSQVFFMHGNRDFTVGQDFMTRFGGQLITAERYPITQHGLNIIVEHGDALCTDDVSYQRFKKIIRHPWLLKPLLALPLPLRRKIAQLARQQSNTQKMQHNPLATPRYPMDVSQQTVHQVLGKHDILLHGHTHQPGIHHYANGKQRIVLGDWRIDQTGRGQAQIALLDQAGLQLIPWHF